MKTAKILNSQGQPIVLGERAQRVANSLQRQTNALGYEINITSLTTILAKISEQKFFEIAPADYIPLKVGEGAWSSNLVKYRSFELGDEFETGVINTGGQNSRLATADAGVDALSIKVFNWAKSIGWSLFDLELAAKSGNWDLVTAKEKARKKNWDLGIQRVAFLGSRGDNGVGGSCLGLLNQAGITINTSVVPKAISSMNTTELKALQADIIEKYRSNCARTAWPTHFIIPESDFNGLAAQASPDFPIKSTLQVLEEAFKIITRNDKFKILPLAYGDAAYSGLGVQRYVLLNHDEDSLVMNIPVDYTNTLANSIDNFSFQNVGYGQYSGVLVLRPLEMMYFQY